MPKNRRLLLMNSTCSVPLDPSTSSKRISKTQSSSNNTSTHPRNIRRRSINSLNNNPPTCRTNFPPVLQRTAHRRRAKDMTSRLAIVDVADRHRNGFGTCNMHPRCRICPSILRCCGCPRPRAVGAGRSKGLAAWPLGWTWARDTRGTGGLWVAGDGGREAIGYCCVSCWSGARGRVGRATRVGCLKSWWAR